MKIKEPVRIRFKTLANGNKSIYLDAYYNGTRDREFLKLYLIPEKSKADKEANKKTLEVANAVKAKRIVTIQNSEHGFKSLSKKSKINFIDYINHLANEEFLKTGNKNSYYYNLRSLASHIKIFAGDKILIWQVNEEFISRFVKYLRTAKNLNCKKEDKAGQLISVNSQHNLYEKLGYVVRKALQTEMISKNPFDKITKSERPKIKLSKREFLTVEEIKTLIATPCKHDNIKRSFLFCCMVGLRFSDIKKITLSDISKDNDGARLLRLQITKTKRFENIPISDEALKWLPDQEDIKGNEPIFKLPNNANSNTHLKKWCEAAGIHKKITFHCSRHTAATLNLSLGVPMAVVSKLLTHSRIATTEIYANILDENKKKAVDKQNGIFD